MGIEALFSPFAVKSLRLRNLVAKPSSIDAVVERLERGDFDLVALGRTLLVDPEWVLKARDSSYRDLRPFDRSAADVVY